MSATCADCQTNFANKKDLLASTHATAHVNAAKIFAEKNWQYALERRDKHRKVHHGCSAECDKEVNTSFAKMKRAQTELRKFGGKRK